jgi:drug/metabolite transporter (DMT)-like permease
MKLILLSLLQSVLTVVGMGLLTIALGGRGLSFRELFSAVGTLPGIMGLVLLFGSFVVTSIILTFARLSVYVPLSTSMVFLVTLLYAVLFQGEKVSLPITLGMVLIVMGIALVSGNRVP